MSREKTRPRISLKSDFLFSDVKNLLLRSQSTRYHQKSFIFHEQTANMHLRVSRDGKDPLKGCKGFKNSETAILQHCDRKSIK